MEYVIRITKEDGDKPREEIYKTIAHLMALSYPNLFVIEGPKDAVMKWLYASEDFIRLEESYTWVFIEE